MEVWDEMVNASEMIGSDLGSANCSDRDALWRTASPYFTLSIPSHSVQSPPRSPWSSRSLNTPEKPAIIRPRSSNRRDDDFDHPMPVCASSPFLSAMPSSQ